MTVPRVHNLTISIIMKQFIYAAALLLLPISLIAQEADTLKSIPDDVPVKVVVKVADSADSAAVSADESDQ